MKNFIKLIKQVHEERFSVVIRKIITEKIPVAFFSLAPTDQAVEITKNLRDQGLNITNLFVIDNAPPRVNLDFNIGNIKAAAQVNPQPEYVFSFSDIEAAAVLKYLPSTKSLIFDNDNKTDSIYKTFMAHLPELQEVYESLIDEESKKTFCGYWPGNISRQLEKIVYANTPHYICSGFIPDSGAAVIDGGSFDGGSAAVFSDMGYKVYSFEMDRINYENTRSVAAEKNFVLENMGLGAYKHESHYNCLGRADNSLNSDGADVVQIMSIDSYVAEKNLPRVDFIKLDVEGAELDTLKGAATTIARFKPILALSAYHKWDDFWTLINFVKSVRPDYEFAMRQFVLSPNEEPTEYKKNGIENILTTLGLEMRWKRFNECVIFAR